MTSLKDYTVEALVSTVDHLGFVSYKVDNLVSEKADEVNETEFLVSSVEQVQCLLQKKSYNKSFFTVFCKFADVG